MKRKKRNFSKVMTELIDTVSTSSDPRCVNLSGKNKFGLFRPFVLFVKIALDFSAVALDADLAPPSPESPYVPYLQRVAECP
jgi:hypothetical protein